MSLFDIFALGLIAIFVVLSLMNGLIAEVLSLARWVIAFVAGRLLAQTVATQFLSAIQPASVAYIVAFILIFILIFILMHLLQNLLSTLLNAIGLSGVNRILGGLLGAIKGVAIITLIVIISSYTDLPKQDEWRRSISAPYFEKMASLAVPYLAQHISRATPYIQPTLQELKKIDSTHPNNQNNELPDIQSTLQELKKE